jgi:hypothetical protein
MIVISMDTDNGICHLWRTAMKTCEQCEHASRATTAGMTSFVWCQENVYGNEDGFVMQSHFINPKAKACGSKFVQRITPLPEEAYIPFTLDGKTEEEASGGDQNDPTTIVSLGASSIDRLKSVIDRFGGIFI